MAASLSKNKKKMEEASTSNPNRIVLPDELLTLNNYDRWKRVIRPNLERHSLWDYLELRNNSLEKHKDMEALEAIKLSCSAEMLPYIMYANYGREAWLWLAEAGTWTDSEKENYTKMLATAATAKAKLDNVPEVDKVLTRRNYGKWKIYMENVFLSKYLWTVVDGSDTPESQFYFGKNSNALLIIRISCGKEMVLFVDEEDKAHDAWRKLESELGAATAPPAARRNDAVAATSNLYSGELLTAKFDGQNSTISSNYDMWKVHMKSYLKVQGLWGFLRKDEISDCVKDEKALDAIKVSCTPEMLAYILYMSCAKGAWVKLATVVNARRHEAHLHGKHCEMVKAAEEVGKALRDFPEANIVLTRSNYEEWERYVTLFLMSRFLSDVLLQFDRESFLPTFTDSDNKNACGLRIIREACGREMMPYIFSSESPRKAMNSLKDACSKVQTAEYMKHSRLLHAIQKDRFREEIKNRDRGLWRGVDKFFRYFPEALTAEIMEDGSTALHVAVRLGRVDFVKELMKLMQPWHSEIKTRQGSTAIAVAIMGNNFEIVKMLVKWNPNLLQIGNELELQAVTIAAVNGNEMIMRYLYESKSSLSTFRWGSRSVASLLTSAARLDAYDIVRELLHQFPDYALLGDEDGMTVLRILAEKPSAFPSGNQFGLIRNLINQLSGNQFGFLRKWINRPVGSTYGTLLKALKIIGVKVPDSKSKHHNAGVILNQICSLLPNLNPPQLEQSFIYDVVHRATIHGIIEVFETLIDTNPYLEHFKDENGRGLFQIAIVHRQEVIFQYMCQMGERNQNMSLLDNLGNNVLHCAAIWDPSSQLVHGPALQMQREIQWFQEVERVVPPRYKETRNNEKLTPQTLFSREHKDLAKEAEKWMKEMANACIIVTALIATVMFAAPFTLPGGTDQNTGVSLTLQSRAFKVFIVSDVISLFAACTSLLIFLSILTARYVESDFLTSLPRRLILGLFTLFISITTMMTTFAATIVIVFHGKARSRSYIWVPLFACIPVLVFSLLQFRLFGNLLLSTYGRGIFRSKRVVVAPLISIGYG